ncbi:MAG: class I SAM-dependent methyltransferase [Bacteroidetes bacterium]|nr:class I SAM-dependent methyltransferase [Bacteroidota bacterium]
MKFNTICIIITLFVSVTTHGQSYRETWQPPEEILDSIGIKPGMMVGEAGAGTGYFTIPLAKRLGPSGKLYANDIDENSLHKLKQKLSCEDLDNVKIIIGDYDDPLFPKGKMEMIVMVYVVHDVSEPVIWLKNLKYALRKDAPLVIIDRDPDKYGKEYDHFWKKSRIIDIVERAGFKLGRVSTFLPRDNIYYFKVTD